MTQFAEIYYGYLNQVREFGVIETNKRTNSRIMLLAGGSSFKLSLIDGVLPTCGLRLTRPWVAAAELAWFLRGEQETTWVSHYTSIWDKFAQKDKAGRSYVEAAYGYRWRTYFGRDQLFDAMDALVSDPSNRRVMVCAWDPKFDGTPHGPRTNVPCPTHFTLSIQAGHLCSSLFLRSSDLFVGLPYDVMNHCMLMAAFARELGVPVGWVQFTMAHLHLYESHWAMADQAVKLSEFVVPNMPLDAGFSLRGIQDRPDEFVGAVRQKERDLGPEAWPTWDPRPEAIL